MNAFSFDHEEKIASFVVEGDFVQSTANELRPAFLKAIKDGAREVRVDLKKSNHIDSPSIGLLLATYNSLKMYDGELVIVNPSAPIVELFTVLQLNKRFKIISE